MSTDYRQVYKCIHMHLTSIALSFIQALHRMQDKCKLLIGVKCSVAKIVIKS